MPQENDDFIIVKSDRSYQQEVSPEQEENQSHDAIREMTEESENVRTKLVVSKATEHEKESSHRESDREDHDIQVLKATIFAQKLTRGFLARTYVKNLKAAEL